MKNWKCNLCKKEFYDLDNLFELGGKATCKKCYDEWLDDDDDYDYGDDWLNCGCCSCCGCSCWEDEEDE